MLDFLKPVANVVKAVLNLRDTFGSFGNVVSAAFKAILIDLNQFQIKVIEVINGLLEPIDFLSKSIGSALNIDTPEVQIDTSGAESRIANLRSEIESLKVEANIPSSGPVTSQSISPNATPTSGTQDESNKEIADAKKKTEALRKEQEKRIADELAFQKKIQDLKTQIALDAESNLSLIHI